MCLLVSRLWLLMQLTQEWRNNLQSSTTELPEYLDLPGTNKIISGTKSTSVKCHVNIGIIWCIAGLYPCDDWNWYSMYYVLLYVNINIYTSCIDYSANSQNKFKITFKVKCKCSPRVCIQRQLLRTVRHFINLIFSHLYYGK